MSKKMVKRSLALGALMAFVITGSAMAAEITSDTVVKYGIYSYPSQNSEVNYYSDLNWDLGSNTLEIEVLKDKESVQSFAPEGTFKKINGTAFNSEKFNTSNYGVFARTSSDGKKVRSYVFSGDSGSLLKISADGTGVYGYGNIEVGELYIDSGRNGFEVEVWANNEEDYNSHGTSIVANKVTIKSDNHGVLAYGKTNLGSADKRIDNLTFEAGDIAIRTASHTIGSFAYKTKGDVKVYTKDLKITCALLDDEGCALEAGGGSRIFVDASGVADIKGDIRALEGTDITLNITGSKSVFNGKTVGEGKIKLGFGDGATWDLTGESSLTEATFNSGSTLVINGADFTGNDYALNGVGNDAKLTVVDGAKLTVTGIDYNTYNIAKGFATVEGTKVDETTTKYWDVTNLNTLMEGKWLEDTENKTLQLEVVAKEAGQMADEMGVSQTTASALNDIVNAANASDIPQTEAAQNVVKFAEALSGVAPEVAGQAVEAVVKMAEAGGNSSTAARVVNNVTNVTNSRLSFSCGHSAPQKGGHGVGLFEEGSGADVWVEYVHGKDEVEDMPSTAGASSYEGQYNGIVMGMDFKKVNKFQSGIAFNYGEGDTNSVGTSSRTHSDYDFWGIGYYGNIHNDDSNVIFDINYAKSDSDVTNYNLAGNYEASPETTTWSAGVKVEKLYQNNNVQIVPYAGLRYMSIDSDDYATKCGTYSYKMDRQDIWLLPVGVSIKQEVANDNGWTVSPRVDLSYIWAFGDTDSNMEFATALNTKTNIGYDVMDDGSFLGLVGIEAHKGQWGYGVAYSYQKGDHSESKKWYVDVNYSF